VGPLSAYTLLVGIVWQFLQRVKVSWLNGPGCHHTAGHLPRKNGGHIHTKTCTRMFKATPPKKSSYLWFHLHKMSWTGKFIETVHFWVLEAGGKAKWAVMANVYRVSFWDDENVLESGSGDDCTSWECSKKQQHWTAHFKMVEMVNFKFWKKLRWWKKDKDLRIFLWYFGNTKFGVHSDGIFWML